MDTITAARPARLRRPAHMASETTLTYTLEAGATVYRTGDTNGTVELVADLSTGAAGWVPVEDLETETYYTTEGSVRGSCGHVHRTVEAAQRCADRDHRDVQRGHGPNAYSDRKVVQVDS